MIIPHKISLVIGQFALGGVWLARAALAGEPPRSDGTWTWKGSDEQGRLAAVSDWRGPNLLK